MKIVDPVFVIFYIPLSSPACRPFVTRALESVFTRHQFHALWYTYIVS